MDEDATDEDQWWEPLVFEIPSEYEKLPINCRLFQNTVNLQDKCLFCKKTEIRN